MIKLVALKVAEDISSHWSETLAWPALLLALHIAALIQIVLAFACLFVWMGFRCKSIYKKLATEVVTEAEEHL